MSHCVVYGVRGLIAEIDNDFVHNVWDHGADDKIQYGSIRAIFLNE